MQPIIKDIILSISDDVVSNLTQSFEKTYYGKMNYSSKNTILDSDNKLLKETIGFEIAFIHVITYFLAYSMSCSHEYMHILNIPFSAHHCLHVCPLVWYCWIRSDQSFAFSSLFIVI